MNPGPTNLMQSLKELPRDAWFLYAGTFINRFGGFVIPFLALYMQRKGFTNSEVALPLMSYGLGHLAAAALGGYLADRIGRRKTIALSMFSSAAAMLLLSQAETLPAITALTALAGSTTELYRPATSALLTDLVTPVQRVTAFAALRWALNAGWALGMATAGFLSERSFHWLFVGDAVTSTLFGIIAWVTLPHGLRATGAAAKWSAAWEVMRHDTRFHKMLLAQFAVALVFLQMSSTFGLHIKSCGFSLKVYGLIIALNGVLIVFLELPLTSYTQRWPAHRVVAVGYALIGLGFASTAWAKTIPAFAVVVIIFTIGEMIAMPVASAYVTENVPGLMRGRYMGAYGLVWALALTFGPSTGIRLHATAPIVLWSACGVLGLFAAWVVLKTRTEPEPRGPTTPR
jgi:MFS family permease